MTREWTLTGRTAHRPSTQINIVGRDQRVAELGNRVVQAFIRRGIPSSVINRMTSELASVVQRNAHRYSNRSRSDVGMMSAEGCCLTHTTAEIGD